MLWLAKFFTKGKTVKDAIKYFHTINGRMPNNLETIKIKNAFMEQTRGSNVIDITSRLKDDWWKTRPGFKRQHPEVAKKTDESPLSALLKRQGKELEGIDQGQGMGFYREMGDMMKKHELEELELKYDEMFNKILEKAKRIESDPLPLLEAELGKKLTGEETTTQLLEFFKNRPKKASGGIARVGMVAGGPIQKGAAWVIKNLKKSRKEVIEGKGTFSKLNSMQKEQLKWELSALIKQLEQGGKIPDDMIQTMRQDKRFKDLVKTPSTDPELRELEEVLLDDWEGEAWDRGRDVVDSLTGPKEIKRRKQIETLKKFDVTGKKGHAEGGIAGPLHLYDGGRIGLKDGKKPKFPMSRRTFIGGILSALAYPFLKGFGKKGATQTAAPVVKEVIERGADGIPSYAWDLINVVKAKGTKEIMEGFARKTPVQKKYTYKGVEVVEDGLGNTSVRKEQTKTGHWYDEATDDSIVDDYVDREVGFEIKKGGYEPIDDYKAPKHENIREVPNEYNESTAIMQGDPEGGMDVSEVLETISDADHLDLKKIADESLIKKSEGGRVDLSKGGLAHVLGV